jgi:hypothetical protein
MIGNRRFHRRRHTQRAMNLAEVVKAEVERYGRPVVLDLLARHVTAMEPACQSNRNLGFDRVIVGPHAAVRGFEEARRGQSLDIRVNVAVVAP